MIPRGLCHTSLVALAVTGIFYCRGVLDADAALSFVVIGLSLGGIGTALRCAPILRTFDRFMPAAPIDSGVRGVLSAMGRG